MERPISFEDLDAWHAARDLTNSIYELCRRQPIARDFGLGDQLRRSAVSVMNNIAEGWESHHGPEKIRFYGYAGRSCGEVRSMSYVLLDNHFIDELQHRTLRDRCVRTGQLVSGLIRSLLRRNS